MNLNSGKIWLSGSILSLGLLWACTEEPDQAENSNPGSFTVTVSDITENSAIVSWTAAADPDNDPVTYSLDMEGQTVASNLTATSYDLSNLTSGKEYRGKVVAEDGEGGSSEASFVFTTTAEQTNSNPGAFEVTVTEITDTGATLTWTAPDDPDNDVLTYSVATADGSFATEGLTSTSYTFVELSSATAYEGFVIASDGKGGSSKAAYSFTTNEAVSPYTLDPALFTSSSFTVEAKLIDCTLENGSTTKCYELTFKANPVPDDGPFCPATINDIGGLGIYDGKTNPGFQVMKKELFQAMEADGYDIIDDNGGIRKSDFTKQDNPKFDYCLQPAVNDNLQLTFTIPAIPVNLSTPNTIESVELIGVSIDGVPMNGDPPSVTTGQMGNGNIPSLDPCGGHHDPSGYYHWHFIPESMNEVLAAYQITEVSCTNKTQSASALSGFAKDGYPIYAYADPTGVPTDLDQCNGHFAATAEYPNGVYHYHASKTEAPNMPPCIKGAAVNEPFKVK